MTRSFFVGAGSVWKFEAEEFRNNLNVPPNARTPLQESVQRPPSPYIEGTPSVFGGVPLIADTTVRSLDVDWDTDDVLVNRNDHVETFSQGTAS